MLGGEPSKVSIDKEGDIAIETKNVYMYVTQFGGSCTVVRAPLSSLFSATLSPHVPDIIAEIHQLRSKYLKPLEYGLRVYCSVWSGDTAAVRQLHTRYFSSLPSVVPSKDNLLDLTDLSCSYSYSFGHFKDKIDVESNPKEVTFRVVRDADARQFADFAKFWSEADIKDMVGKIEPFLDTLGAKQSGISAILGLAGTTKR